MDGLYVKSLILNLFGVIKCNSVLSCWLFASSNEAAICSFFVREEFFLPQVDFKFSATKTTFNNLETNSTNWVTSKEKKVEDFFFRKTEKNLIFATKMTTKIINLQTNLFAKSNLI